jgi:hypothetical protein
MTEDPALFDAMVDALKTKARAAAGDTEDDMDWDELYGGRD